MDSENRFSWAQQRGGSPLLALGVLLVGFLASLYVLIDKPSSASAAGHAAVPGMIAPAGSELPDRYQVAQAAAPSVVQKETPIRSVSAATTSQSAVAALAPPEPSFDGALQSAGKLDQTQMELDGALDELKQSHDNLAKANEVQRRTLVACAIFLLFFACIAVAAIIQVYMQARKCNKQSLKSVGEVEAIVAQLKPLTEAQEEVRSMLPRLLQEVGEQPLRFQEEGGSFTPKALAVLEDVDHLAYMGDARLFFGKPSSSSELAVYLNGLLLSAVAYIARSDSWNAFARLGHFFDLLAQHPDAVDRHRVAQAYSYRASAAYQALDALDKEPSWLRKSDLAQADVLSRQAFSDVAQASSLDSEWRHTVFVEAQLCSRFYIPEELAENSSRAEYFLHGLRRAVTLYKGLIEEKQFRGAARHNLARCLKRIAEQTGEKSDFSDFGYALSGFPTDEELADEALASRRPNSHDRFLWQSMLGDQEIFHAIQGLNLAEYRSFWIRLLDSKVHLRNWRADLAELQQANPAMRDWSVQLLHPEGPIALLNTGGRRSERFDLPSSGL